MGVWESVGVSEYARVWEYGSVGVCECVSVGEWKYGSVGVWERVWEYGSVGECGSVGV